MTYASALPSAVGLSGMETIAPIVPMFHVNAWGIPFYAGKVAKKCVPDDVVFVADLPLTATGKLQKLALRQRFGKHFIDAATRSA